MPLLSDTRVTVCRVMATLPNGGVKQMDDVVNLYLYRTGRDDGMTPAPSARCPFEAFH